MLARGRLVLAFTRSTGSNLGPSARSRNVLMVVSMASLADAYVADSE